MSKNWRAPVAVILLCGFVTSGCLTTVGSRALPKTRFNYNEAIADSWNEQLLLNLVRLRYRDTMHFLEVSSVLSQYAITGSASPIGIVGFSSSSADELELTPTIGYEDRPTITYTPLTGQDFVRRLLSPISPDDLTLLSGSGWSVARLLRCCVDRLNDLDNAISAAGPTPESAPRYEDFYRASELLRKMQIASVLEVIDDTKDDGILLVFHSDRVAGLENDLEELRKLLGLDSSTDRYTVNWEAAKESDRQIYLKGRSLLGVLFYLSQGVTVPAEHHDKGLVTVTRTQDGQTFDWSRITGDLLTVSSSSKSPHHAYVKIFYRGHWFYIDDSDLTSKATFALLTYLFSLQSTSKDSLTPTVTVSAGGS